MDKSMLHNDSLSSRRWLWLAIPFVGLVILPGCSLEERQNRAQTQRAVKAATVGKLYKGGRNEDGLFLFTLPFPPGSRLEDVLFIPSGFKITNSGRTPDHFVLIQNAQGGWGCSFTIFDLGTDMAEIAAACQKV